MRKWDNSKYGLTTNFDLDVEFTPVTIGPDQGGNPYIVQDGKFLIVNGRYVLDDPNNEGAYIDLGTFGEADSAVVNEFVMDDQGQKLVNLVITMIFGMDIVLLLKVIRI